MFSTAGRIYGRLESTLGLLPATGLEAAILEKKSDFRNANSWMRMPGYAQD
jgi:hypothetical protein